MTDETISALVGPVVTLLLGGIAFLTRTMWVRLDRTNRLKRDLLQAQDEVGFIEKWWAARTTVGLDDQQARKNAEDALTAAYSLARESATTARIRREPVTMRRALSWMFLLPRQHIVGKLLTILLYWPLLLLDLISLVVIGQLAFQDGGDVVVNVLTTVSMISLLIFLPWWGVRRGLVALDEWCAKRTENKQGAAPVMAGLDAGTRQIVVATGRAQGQEVERRDPSQPFGRPGLNV